MCVSETRREFCIEDRVAVPRLVVAGCEIVGTNSKPLTDLTQDLIGGNPVARLDSRDVGRRAAGKRELPLGHTRLLTGLPNSLPHRARIVDMR
jgi:hypothetical protein